MSTPTPRFPGSNGIAVALVPKENFRWTEGEEHIATWKKPDADWQKWFGDTGKQHQEAFRG